VVTWVRANTLLAVAAVAWLVALAPAGKIGKGIAHVVALASVIESVRYSRKLVLQETRYAAMRLMNTELEQVDLTLQARAQELALQEMHGLQSTYSPEVREELEESLEHLVHEPAAKHDHETSTSQKPLYTAVKKLLEAGKSETYIIEEVLHMGGRKFADGRKLLRELLELGEQEEW
jgi:hypothetical protein